MKLRIYHQYNGKWSDIIKENSKYVILAGDDDQAIYGWAGADVKKFQQEISKKDIILPQSYRVPQNVQNIADKILDLIPEDRRIKKNWKAREEEGKIQLHLWILDGCSITLMVSG